MKLIDTDGVKHLMLKAAPMVNTLMMQARDNVNVWFGADQATLNPSLVVAYVEATLALTIALIEHGDAAAGQEIDKEILAVDRERLELEKDITSEDRGDMA